MIAASMGTKETWAEVPEGATIQDVLNQLALPVPPNWTATSINGTVRTKNTPLKEGDELLVIPAGGGG